MNRFFATYGNSFISYADAWECHVLKFVYTILWYSIFFSLSGMPDKLKSFLLYCYRLSQG